MDEQRRELVPVDPLPPAVREGVFGVVGAPALRPEAAEEGHYREIDLTVRPGGGGVDEPVRPLPVDLPDESVACPQVAVDEGGRLGRSAPLRRVRPYTLEEVAGAGVESSLADGALDERADPPVDVEVRPVRARGEVDLRRAEVAELDAIEAAERVVRRAVQAGQGGAEGRLGRFGAAAALGDPFQDKSVRRLPEDLRHVQVVGGVLAQRSQPGGLPLEETGRRGGMRLAEDGTVCGVESVGRGDVATGERRHVAQVETLDELGGQVSA